MKTLAETIGKNIRVRRKAMRMTQKKLGDKVGTDSQRMVSLWENGYCCPHPVTMCALADVFGCSVDELLGRVHGCLETD